MKEKNDKRNIYNTNKREEEFIITIGVKKMKKKNYNNKWKRRRWQ